MARAAIDDRGVLDEDAIEDDRDARRLDLLVIFVVARRGEKDVVRLPISRRETRIDEWRRLPVDRATKAVRVGVVRIIVKNLNLDATENDHAVVPSIPPRTFKIRRAAELKVELEVAKTLLRDDSSIDALEEFFVVDDPLRGAPGVQIGAIKKDFGVWRGGREMKRLWIHLYLRRYRALNVVDSILAPPLFRIVSISNPAIVGKNQLPSTRGESKDERHARDAEAQKNVLVFHVYSFWF